MKDNFENIIPKFGDEKAIQFLRRNHIKDLETTKITIDLRKLIKAGVERSQALNLIERLLKK
jgi:hypothetical protein